MITLASHPPARTAGATAWLSPDCSLKLLEEPAVYNRVTDELYFVSAEGFEWLKQAAGEGAARPAGARDQEFYYYCLAEQIINISPSPARQMPIRQSPVPSPRYLLLHITDRCNLHCRHCFLGEAGTTDMPPEIVGRIIDEFEELQGLRLIISGGEPLLHPRFEEINAMLAGRNLRRILLTNGSFIDTRTAPGLNFDQAQISIDGLEAGHDWLRGRGSFRRTVAASLMMGVQGIELSVATILHSRNLDELDMLETIVRRIGAREWSIDVPARTGRLLSDPEPLVDPVAAGPLMNRSYGGAIHESRTDQGCGAHLMAVMPDGKAALCGYYASEAAGHISEGLGACWQKSRTRTGYLPKECGDCSYLVDCRGGCRFRASGYNDPSAVDCSQCSRFRSHSSPGEVSA